jgi:hypothetical protein
LNCYNNGLTISLISKSNILNIQNVQKIAKTPGMESYYETKMAELETAIREKVNTTKRLEAQRNELNGKVGG